MLGLLRRRRLQWEPRSTAARMGKGTSAEARTDLGNCRLGNCTFGKLTLKTKQKPGKLSLVLLNEDFESSVDFKKSLRFDSPPLNPIY